MREKGVREKRCQVKGARKRCHQKKVSGAFPASKETGVKRNRCPRNRRQEPFLQPSELPPLCLSGSKKKVSGTFVAKKKVSVAKKKCQAPLSRLPAGKGVRHLSERSYSCYKEGWAGRTGRRRRHGGARAQPGERAGAAVRGAGRLSSVRGRAERGAAADGPMRILAYCAMPEPLALGFLAGARRRSRSATHTRRWHAPRREHPRAGGLTRSWLWA